MLPTGNDWQLPQKTITNCCTFTRCNKWQKNHLFRLFVPIQHLSVAFPENIKHPMWCKLCFYVFFVFILSCFMGMSGYSNSKTLSQKWGRMRVQSTEFYTAPLGASSLPQPPSHKLIPSVTLPTAIPRLYSRLSLMSVFYSYSVPDFQMNNFLLVSSQYFS